jgi:hypothetical protein
VFDCSGSCVFMGLGVEMGIFASCHIVHLPTLLALGDVPPGHIEERIAVFIFGGRVFP